MPHLDLKTFPGPCQSQNRALCRDQISAFQLGRIRGPRRSEIRNLDRNALPGLCRDQNPDLRLASAPVRLGQNRGLPRSETQDLDRSLLPDLCRVRNRDLCRFPAPALYFCRSGGIPLATPRVLEALPSPDRRACRGLSDPPGLAGRGLRVSNGQIPDPARHRDGHHRPALQMPNRPKPVPQRQER